jgi:hypothetical protein
VYRIQQKLGRAFRELEPYCLYPLENYFGGTTKEKAENTTPFLVETPKTEELPRAKPVLKFPVKRAA